MEKENEGKEGKGKEEEAMHRLAYAFVLDRSNEHGQIG